MLWQLGEMSAGKEFQMMEQRREGGRACVWVVLAI